jgi:putative Flp pilus-assembly TadE/G-like protein
MNSAPRGQILPIVGVAMIVLLGIAALVIDLGFSWTLLRREQNAVDPASVAAARYLPDSNWTEAYKAACFYVQEHGFFEGDDATCGAARAAGDLYVGTPRAGDYAGDTGAVEVAIEAEHPAFFGRIFGQETASVSTYAVAANGATGVGNVNANSLVAFDPESCGAGQINGNGEVNITNDTGGPGGFVYVNSLCGIDPPGGSTNDICDNSATGGFTMNGNPSSLTTEHVFVRGTCDANPGPWDGDTTEGAPEITDGIFGLIEPSTAGQPEWGRTSCPTAGNLLSPGPGCSFTSNTPATLSPGVYYGGIVISGRAQVRFNPGVYYIAGGGIQYQGNASSAFEVIGGTGGNPGRALFFSTGDPTYGGICALDPTFPQNSPPQFGQPDANLTSDGTWVTETSAAGTYTAIAELVGDATADVTYLASPQEPTAPNHFEVSLTDIVPPIPDSGVFVRYRYGKPLGSDGVVNLEVELLQGTTVIASQTHSNVPTVSPWTDGSFELTVADLAEITNWADLRLNFKATSTAGTNPDLDRALVSWAQLQIPADSSRHCQGMIRLAGQADLKAFATDVEPWAGLLFWQDGTLDGNGRANNPVAMIDVQGNGGMLVGGTIYAPKALVKIAGNGTSEADVAAVQVLAWQFQIGGNGLLNMPYNPDAFFGTPESAQKGLVE